MRLQPWCQATFPLICAGRSSVILGVRGTRVLPSGMSRVKLATVEVGVWWTGCRGVLYYVKSLTGLGVHDECQRVVCGYKMVNDNHSGYKGFLQ